MANLSALRRPVAEEGIQELSKNVDSLITIPNQKLLSILGEDTPLLEAFATVDDVVSSAVQGIADLIIRPGMINVDFADVKTVMSEKGSAMMGSGMATGDSRAREAAERAAAAPALSQRTHNNCHDPILSSLQLRAAMSC